MSENRLRLLALGHGLLLALQPLASHATSMGVATGSLELEITAPGSLPAGFVLNPGGTIPSNFLFPDGDNGGAGSLVGAGEAGCTPTGCTDPAPGVDIAYQLSTDLTCTSDPDGSYGGLEDSFANFGASNSTAGSVTLDLRFISSWSVSATAVDPPDASAEAGVDIVWAVPTFFCAKLDSCPTGSLVGGSPSPSCPAGYLLSPVLVLASSFVDTSTGDEMDSGPQSVCDLDVEVLAGGSSGGDLAVTSSCSARGCPVLSLSDDTVLDSVTEEACEIELGPDYQVSGPDGDLTARAGRTIRIRNGFSAGVDAKVTFELDPSLIP